MEFDQLLIQNAKLVEFTLPTSPGSEREGLFDAIGMELLRRFDETASIDYRDRAITMEWQAVELTPEGHPNRSMYLNNLAIALHSRFERMGSMDDLDRAIVTNAQAIEFTVEDHPNRAMYFNNFGIALQSRFERTGSMDDLDRTIA